jgi:molybdate transport system substrate-binding protein
VTARDAAAQEAKRFVAYVMSPAGQEILSRYGFQKP